MWAPRYHTLSVGLGVLLLAASLLKLHALLEGAAYVDATPSFWLLGGIIELELLFGFWLLGGLFARPTRVAAMLCFAAFAGSALSRLLAGHASCGCFGSVQVHPGIALLFDVLAIMLLGMARIERIPASRRRAVFVGSLALLMSCGSMSVLVAASPAELSAEGVIVGDGDRVALRPQDWVGKPFPLAKHVDIGAQLTSGQWRVLLYRRDCDLCRRAMSHYRRGSFAMAAQAEGIRLAVLEMPPYGRVRSFGPQVLTGRFADRRLWSAPPVEILLRGGIVIGVSDTPPADPIRPGTTATALHERHPEP